ncbi:hypothetical protein L6452_34536 [Arctium lappa]|uniref:Uncharacterized protein n=1 Tax=Arctium lappa TaxID=4217 RepID=A0ACB8YII0_ARCLA|nr:hypothetical protein L6452_34536 [Arctium lappa]
MKLSQLLLLLQILMVGFVNAIQYKRKLCPHKCGNVDIPYPFGTEETCYLDKSYRIECNSTTQIPHLSTDYYLAGMEVMTSYVQVLEIKLDGFLRVALPIAYSCYSKQGMLISGSPTALNTTRFPFSSTLNRFTGVGCDVEARIMLAEQQVVLSCELDCERSKVRNGSCLGHGCCQIAPIPEGVTSAAIVVVATENHTKIWDYYGKCGYGFIVEKHKYNFNTADLGTMSKNMSFPVVLDWSVGDTECKEAQKDNVTYRCQENSVCYNAKGSLSGYRCKCSDGYRGNPYLKNGCEDINECESAKLNDCLPGQCNNTDGSYTCVCSKGFQGDAKIGGECIPLQKSEEKAVIAGIGEGVAGAAVAMIFVYWGAKRRIRIKSRKDFFKKNGGIMLQEMLFTCEDPINKGKIFTEEELKKATDNFNNSKVIGQGGYGTVYIGTLANKTLVAIKKSKMIDQSQIKQFVNEVIILSQINHPNIVKLLGCCLETHVPLLVYEYITNNTLCHHIQSHATLTLEKRLKIAAETAEALDYMHSTTQIIHRDVKPSNILLDDELTAKISDFGISRSVPLGQTHLSTSVKGTVGYMDPEYFHTCKLTEKSDVYSFGVVLMELLTGTEIQSLEIPLTSYKGAAAYLTSLLTCDALVQVLDDQIKKDEYAEVVKCVAKIAINCLDLEGKTRPTMSNVKQELEQLRCVLFSIDAERI